jgi:hypothetical protein
MEQNDQKKAAKPSAKKNNSSALRVSNDTRKKVLSELAKANKKTFGRRIKADQLIALGLSRLTAQDIVELQEKSLSNQDKMEKAYRDYVSKFGQVSRDEFIGKMMNGEVAKFTSENAAILEGK